MRCGRRCGRRVPVEPHLDPVGGAGQRPEPEPDLADVDARVAVQREDPLDAVERALVDQLHGTARHDLLGRLEEQPDPARQQAAGVHLGQRQRRRPTRAAVWTSWPQAWATPGDGAPPTGRRCRSCDRQRVHVGAQRDHRPVGAEVRDHPGAGEPGSPASRPARRGRPRARRCGVSVQDSSGCGVQVAAQVDQLVVVLVDDVSPISGRGVGRMASELASAPESVQPGSPTGTRRRRAPGLQLAGGRRRASAGGSGRDRHDLALGLLARQRLDRGEQSPSAVASTSAGSGSLDVGPDLGRARRDLARSRPRNSWAM